MLSPTSATLLWLASLKTPVFTRVMAGLYTSGTSAELLDEPVSFESALAVLSMSWSLPALPAPSRSACVSV